MLDMHPEIVGGPEFLHLPRIVELRGRLRETAAAGKTDAYCPDPARIDAVIADLIEALLRPLAERHGTGWLSEKTPQNALILGELLEIFPQARALFVLRDPRAVVASLRAVGRRVEEKGRRPKAFTGTVHGAVDLVARYLDAAAGLEGHERVRLLRYEDLVTDPEPEMRAICAFLGLDWEEAMLHPASRPHLGEAAITRGSSNIWYDAASFNRDPDPAAVDRWKTMLGPRDRALVTLAFAGHPLLRRFGYDLDAERISRPARMAAAASAAWISAKRRALDLWRRRRLLRPSARAQHHQHEESQ